MSSKTLEKLIHLWAMCEVNKKAVPRLSAHIFQMCSLVYLRITLALTFVY